MPKNNTNKTFIVAIADLDSINNFEWLPPRFYSDELDAHIIVHTSPSVVSSSGKPIFNFDVLIEPAGITVGSKLGVPWHDILDPKAYYANYRESKISQLIKLNRAYSDYNSKYAKYLNIYINGNNEGVVNSTSFGHGNIGPIVVKPEHGARGIGHLIVDFNKVSVAKFKQQLITSENLNQLKESFPGLINEMGEQDESSRAEGFNILKQASFGQEYIPSISEEYRIITNAQGEPCYIQKRSRKGNEYKQATGSTDVLDENNVVKNITDIPIINRDIEAFSNILKNVIGPMKSLDLYVTNNSEWGIFEYCNQFGTAGIPRAISEKIHCDFVVSLLKKQLDNKG